MSIIYKPVLIESPEQAEALPVGTVGYEPPHLYAYIKKARNYWLGTGDDAALTGYEMLAFTALVPIEAEQTLWRCTTRTTASPCTTGTRSKSSPPSSCRQTHYSPTRLT